MKSERFPKILLTSFVSALVVYIVAFAWLQSCRTGKGAWQVAFSTDLSGTPAIWIKQAKLNISKQIVFSEQNLEQTNLTHTFVFDDPAKTNAPFGEIVFQDLTFLPGTVTFNFFGHEVELLPRVLIIDKQEHAWKTGDAISVTGPGKFKPLPRK